MGTSSSSSGPGSGISLDPPWLNSVAADLSNGSLNANGEQVQNPNVSQPARFRDARRNLGAYASTGNSANLKTALGHYSRNGMGGAKNVAQRMRAATSAGAGIFSFYQLIHSHNDPGLNLWIATLSNKQLSSEQISDAIIEKLVLTGGSLDEESCKHSMAEAMSELLLIDSNLDLLSLQDSDVWLLLELFLTKEAYHRVTIDIGQLFESDKYSPRDVVSRTNEMEGYLKAEISAQMRALRINISHQPTFIELNNLLQSAIESTFSVFEEE